MTQMNPPEEILEFEGVTIKDTHHESFATAVKSKNFLIHEKVRGSIALI